ncbi:MAG: LytTR family transcriptional regulator DNA-binding domain-containing protein [Bacteroidaceae bacterium]|nr:LytTR family transcriptional regulator DNA-binding domain-containing protein [Bacteroidaceae bacterium]
MTPIIFNTRDELIRIDLDKMVYAMAEDNYVYLYFRNGQHAMVCASLQSLEQLILNRIAHNKTGKYIRIGRKYIVNESYITHINVQKQQLVLSDLDHIAPITLQAAREALKTLKQSILEIKNN